MDARAWDERYAGTELLWTADPNRFLVAEVAELPAARALDLACGEGRNAVWLAERGWTVTGVDFSRVALEKARRLAEARSVAVAWELADVTEYRPGARAFELVIVMYLHLPAEFRREVFGRAASAVAPGGTMLVVAHDITNPADGYGGPQDASVLYGPDDIVADLTAAGEAGLRIRKAERVRRPVATDAGERNAIDVLVRATK